jgi:hypothetical protein
MLYILLFIIFSFDQLYKFNSIIKFKIFSADISIFLHPHTLLQGLIKRVVMITLILSTHIAISVPA